MSHQSQGEELVLKPSSDKWFMIAGFCLIGGALGVTMIIAHKFMGWVLIPLMTVGAVVSLSIPFLSRMRLRLSPAGLTFGTLRRRYQYRWSDITSFFDLSTRSRLRVVGFTFAPSYTGEQKVRHINQEFGGFDRFMPDTYGMQPAELAGLLESWRLKHGVDRVG